ncbi:MAG: DMT family transporter [Firmicutes bacterium]|nr:DMT family transporter [Bacillota bacterium]
MSKKMKSNLMLLLTAIIWGSAFVAQKAGTVLEPFTYTGIRMLIGGLVLIPVIMIFAKMDKTPDTRTIVEKKAAEKMNLIGGLWCGIVLCIASNLQQMGMYFDTDAGKAGFITTLYVVIVPVLGLFLKRKVKPIVWGCIALAVVGFYLLTMAGSGAGFSLALGDFFVLLCAFVFAIHILVVDHFIEKCDGIKLSSIQFLTTGIISLILMAIFENPVMADIISCAGAILYCGVLSSGVAYTLQVLGQKDAEPATASLILSLESVFAVIFGALILHESMTTLELIGCVVIFVAVLIPQLPSKEERLQNK